MSTSPSLGWFMLIMFSIEVLGQDECYITQRPPRKPRVGLSFCHWAFPASNCCLPGFDSDMAYYYSTLVQTTDSCAYLEDKSRIALKYWFCFGCSDHQPAYLKNLGERMEDGETFTLHEISICSSFASDMYPEKFDKCGMIIPGDRESECFGDDTVIPSQHWGTGEEGVLAFLNDDVGGKPPFFENSSDDHFVVVIAAKGDPCYGNSGSSLLSAKSIWVVLFVSSFLNILVAFGYC